MKKKEIIKKNKGVKVDDEKYYDDTGVLRSKEEMERIDDFKR